jgi:hypothetical protein
MGKLLSRSWNEWISFFFGRLFGDVGESGRDASRGGKGGLLPVGKSFGTVAVAILTSSNIPSRGLEM